MLMPFSVCSLLCSCQGLYLCPYRLSSWGDTCTHLRTHACLGHGSQLCAVQLRPGRASRLFW